MRMVKPARHEINFTLRPSGESQVARARAATIGCSSLGGGSRRQNIATVIQTAYDLGRGY